MEKRKTQDGHRANRRQNLIPCKNRLETSRYTIPFSERFYNNNNNNNNNNIYLLQLGCHPEAVVSLHVYKI
jgi:hypothetical protein